MNDTQISTILQRGISGFGVLADAKAEELLARILDEVDFGQEVDGGQALNDDVLHTLAAAGNADAFQHPKKV